jgi:hypothetical protein
MSYGSYESTQSIEVEAEGEYHEAIFDFTLTCTSPGCAAQLYGPPENCYPAEAAEFELDSVAVLDGESNPHIISVDILANIVGRELADKLVEKAIEDAQENMEDY